MKRFEVRNAHFDKLVNTPDLKWLGQNTNHVPAHPAVIEAIVASLKRWSPKHIVLDPVMVATSGDRLLNAGAVEALRRDLVPIASILTPNLPEAAVLLDEAVATDADAIQRQGKRLLANFLRA